MYWHLCGSDPKSLNVEYGKEADQCKLIATGKISLVSYEKIALEAGYIEQESG